MLGEIFQYFEETWRIAVFLGTVLLPFMLKFLLSLAIIIGIVFVVLFISGAIVVSLGFVDLPPEKNKQQTTSQSAKEEATSPPKACEDSPDPTSFAGDRKRRLEIEVEILEEVLHERREELAKLA
ncbi:hypothetical protein PENANT_c014G01083 [Penicillium antarcticum]|uniref:Uncharacterized protein n=1 Tax=Penicillium antarcticum TaxID=416450 RepID=A0A1V6Q539_9EURO|nr:uncharacterized protein N7508_009502 [Penicillium antarcticum]KAJ5294681.1 hypothetical protein N7508_009502 [Penicillium antarcticum]OQD83992.1 hypothetical protein PENANT_c014G01083 [Penicillium antarcticum]